MKKWMAISLLQAILIFSFTLALVVVGDIQTAKGQNASTVEGVWVITSSNYPDKDGGYTIVRKGDGYDVIPKNAERGGKKYHGVGLYYGSPTEIMATSTPSFDALMGMFEGEKIPTSVIGELAGKVTLRFKFKLSADGRSMEHSHDYIMVHYYPKTGRLQRYEIMPYADKAILARVAGPPKVENRSDRAYQADCGPVDPNRTTPITTDLCPGNLVAMTYFCGGGMGCPYVCCPRGLPYLNHCDCKCYATSEFDCSSYSRCQEQPRQ